MAATASPTGASNGLVSSVAPNKEGEPQATALKRPNRPSAHSRWHHEQRARVLASHPEVRKLFGSEPLQLFGVLGLLTLRWGVAWAVSYFESPVWLIGVLSCTVGCWLVHGAGTYIHEQGHRLIVSREPLATAVDVLLEMGATTFGISVSYQYKHVNFHHVYLGDYEWDSEMRDLCAHVSVLTAEQRSEHCLHAHSVRSRERPWAFLSILASVACAQPL